VKLLAAIASPFLACTRAQAQQPDIAGRRLSPDDVRRVAPALEKYTQDCLYGEVWQRPGLMPRDRSLITIALARNLTLPMSHYLNRALENGVKPSEISEAITHLAFYAGWANAFAAVGAKRDVFAERGIGPDQVAPPSPPHRYGRHRKQRDELHRNVQWVEKVSEDLPE
jgi:4-carboxymuconolactone decarboxylase